MNSEHFVYTMKARIQEKEKAIELRKNGQSYRDILNVIPVAKSSLSLWLKDLPLTEEEKRALRHRKDANISHGRIKAAAALTRNRLEREKSEFIATKQEFEKYLQDPLFFTGIGLYWAEGSKRSYSFQFMNSDTDMVCFMIMWCKRYLQVKDESIYLRLYLHKPYAHEKCEEYWSEATKIPLSRFKTTIYKPSGLVIKKRPSYKGCIRVELAKGKGFLRKMQFFQKLLIDYFSKKIV